MDIELPFAKDNTSLDKYKKCRDDLLSSIKNAALKPLNSDDNW
jgi:hypothetical protein